MGFSCVEGVCQTGCVEIPGIQDVCNGIDEDCDGTVDEDIFPEICDSFDNDCDGEIDEDLPPTPEFCGNDADDDCDGNIDEGSMELCNGLDDDCDGSIDNAVAAPLCSDGLLCTGAACVPRTCANDPALDCSEEEFCNIMVDPVRCEERSTTDVCDSDGDCEANQVCFETANLCVESTPFGTPCSDDSTCIEGDYCADLQGVGLTGQTCTHTCCDDSDCAEGVCRTRWLGIRLCVPEADGGKLIGESCSSIEDCASGYCALNGQCAPACGSNADCDGGGRCIFRRRSSDNGYVRGCESPPGSGQRGEECFRSSSCEQNYCSGSSFRCLEGCSTGADCGGAPQACWVAIFSTGPNTFCFPQLPSEVGIGESCSTNNDCASNRCDRGRCVDPCCSSSQCGNGLECRPIRSGDFWPTFCLEP